MTDKIELPDEKLHQGHRARMRDKFLKHGPDIFDTYELLEMLLYYAVPYKDTNPIAKRLLMRFGSLDGVLTADPSELAEISGIGKRAAELIVTIGRMPEALCLASDTDAVIHNDYDVAGARMVEYFKNSKTRGVAVLLLDNSMRERGIATVYDDVHYGSGAVKAAPFINQALLAGASVVITAHNHPYGPAIASASDLETNKMIDQALEQVGIAVAEHYVVSGNKYFGTKERHSLSLLAGTELDKFRQSRERAATQEEDEV